MLEFARWITERDYRAALMAAGLVLLPLLAPASCAVLALVALQRGPGAAWRTGAMAAVLLALVAGLSGAHPVAGVLSALTIWAPTLAVAQLLISTGSLSAAARLAATGAIVLAGAWAAVAPVQGEPWLSLVADMVGPLAQQTGVDAALLAERLLSLIPGVIAASLLVVSLIGLFLAMWLHAGLAQPGAFGEAFRELQFGPVVGGIGALSMIGAVSTDYPVAWAIALPAGAALLLQGIAIMHAMVRIKGMHRAWLAAGWATLVILSPWAMIGFAVYGMADTVMDLRRRAAGKV
ncbi:MAG: hypothetical protein ACNA8J_03710 [Gammaproteobacteria bacterium]